MCEALQLGTRAVGAVVCLRSGARRGEAGQEAAAPEGTGLLGVAIGCQRRRVF